jgi:hypothetical protein
MRSIPWAVALVLLLTHSLWADDPTGGGGAPPLPWAGETFKPPEVTDREKSTDPYPFVICPKKRQDGTIEYQAIYADGFEVKYVPGVSFVVRTPTDYGPIKIFYDLAKRGARTVIEAPTPPTHKTTPGRVPIIRDLPLSPRSAPIRKTTPRTPTTVERPPTTSTQETPPTVRITFIVKAGATEGDPGEGATVHFHVLAITVEQFVAGEQGKTAPVDYPWGDGKEGPVFNPLVPPPPPPDGEPPEKTYSFVRTSMTTLFGWNMLINIGWGWAHATVPAGMVFACADMEEYQKHLKEAEKLRDLAKKAELGGPGYWLRLAQADRSYALELSFKRLERALAAATMAKALLQAEGYEELAKELEKRGVPDKPDPKLPKAERDAIEKERAAAIKKIDDEALDHVHRAGRALRDAL